MLNRKSLELSLNFIIIIIISIIIFVFGVSFISRLSSEASNLQKLTYEDIDRRIADIACEGSDRVCIGIDRKIIQRKSFDVFGIKIVNVLDPQSGNGQDFNVIIAPAGFIQKGSLIQSSILPNSISIYPQSRPPVFIKKNEDAKVGVGIEVLKGADSGTYIFDVNVRTLIKQSSGSYTSGDYTRTLKFYVEVP